MPLISDKTPKYNVNDVLGNLGGFDELTCRRVNVSDNDELKILAS